MLFRCISSRFIVILCLGLSFPHSARSKATFSEVLNKLFNGSQYEPKVRPNVDGPPVHVTTGFWVLSIDSVSVIDMAFGIDIFLRQDWVDKRLNHGLNSSLSLSNTMLSKVWLPDSYFKNAKKSNFHEVTAKNLMILIRPNGKVHYNSRVTLKVSCIMDLRLYPFDIQHCPLIMESYGYSVDHIIYQWEIEEGNGMAFVPSDVKVLPQFNLIDLQLSSQYTRYIVGMVVLTDSIGCYTREDAITELNGNWSGVVANFTFQRTQSFYIIHIYGPSALIVVISWISFMLPFEQAPARVTLAVTSVLTEVTILTMSNHAMPRVNYVKAIDKYLITCFLFVFASLVEYSLILTLANREQQLSRDKQKNVRKRKLMSSAFLKPENDKITAIQVSDDICVYQRKLHKLKPSKQEFSGSANAHIERSNTACQELKHCFYREEIIVWVDKISLQIFPLFFIVFNLFYWFSLFYYPHLIISK